MQKIDFDGDGAADSLSADVVFNHEFRARGAVRVQSPMGAPVAVIYAPETNDFFGESVLGLGDIDGVAGDEIAVSAPFAHNDGSRSGRVYIYAYHQPEPIMVLEYDGVSEEVFGIGLSLSPDVDGDGVPELMVLVDPIYEYPQDPGYDIWLEWRMFSLVTGLELDSGTVEQFPETTNWNSGWSYRFGLRADMNVDGIVSQDDVDYVLSRVGTESMDMETHIPGDLNGDFVIDGADVLLVSADLGLSASWVKSLPWKKIIGKAKGVGKSAGFFALVRAAGCIAAIDAIIITCEIYTDTTEEYVLCICMTLADSDGVSIFCKFVILGYDIVGAVRDYIGCGGLGV